MCLDALVSEDTLRSCYSERRGSVQCSTPYKHCGRNAQENQNIRLCGLNLIRVKSLLEAYSISFAARTRIFTWEGA